MSAIVADPLLARLTGPTKLLAPVKLMPPPVVATDAAPATVSGPVLLIPPPAVTFSVPPSVPAPSAMAFASVSVTSWPDADTAPPKSLPGSLKLMSVPAVRFVVPPTTSGPTCVIPSGELMIRLPDVVIGPAVTPSAVEYVFPLPVRRSSVTFPEPALMAAPGEMVIAAAPGPDSHRLRHWPTGRWRSDSVCRCPW